MLGHSKSDFACTVSASIWSFEVQSSVQLFSKIAGTIPSRRSYEARWHSCITPRLIDRHDERAERLQVVFVACDAGCRGVDRNADLGRRVSTSPATTTSASARTSASAAGG